jgi:vacuolar-type H+-ATPase subunit E/Vma4
VAEESAEKGKRELISGIESDAEQEAERILSQAEKEAAENRAGVENQVRDILREAGKKAAAQAEAAGRKILSGVEVEVRRKLLQGQYRVLSEVVEKVRARMRDLAKNGEHRESGGRAVAYRAVLKSWIVEAMVGLGSERAEISASALDLPYIDETLLVEAAERVKQLTGRTVKLSIAGGAGEGFGGTLSPGAVDSGGTGGQGLVLTDRERRVAFNNRLETRLLRKERRIQALIYDALFRDMTQERI